jgi:hypothetical protein
MDRMLACEADDPGSIPGDGTVVIKKPPEGGFLII